MSGDRTPRRNEGEGNYTAAKAYDKAQADFARSGKVEKAARDAAEALAGPERDELERAERKSRARAKKRRSARRAPHQARSRILAFVPD